MQVNNVVRLPTSLDNFFTLWLTFLYPFHSLTDTEIKVAGCFLKHRYNFSKVIKDDKILNDVTLGEDTRKKIRGELGIKPQHFQIIIGKLKGAKFIFEGKINSKFIPNLKSDSEDFKFMLLFDMKSNG